MKALLYLIAGLGVLKSFGIRSDVDADNDSFADTFGHEVSKNLSDEKGELYLETTVIPISGEDPRISYKDYFQRPKLLVSDPLFEKDGPWNVSAFEDVRLKRFLPDEEFTHENKMMLLQLHNVYRGNVTPPAGDMAYLEWDDELAKLAQMWSDGCNFTHGMPENDFELDPGQNLYIGTDPTGYIGLKLWFDEHHYYDHRKDKCIPGKQCGHYKQMVWSQSKKLGCGMTKCDNRYLITCHYYPPALGGMQIYRVAKPCSQCPDKMGSLCLENLCMTWEQCKNNPFDCKFAKCDLKCLNCGKLDEKKCLCECTDGWDSPDCSYLCADKHVRCGKSPGWPTKVTCSMNRYAVAHTYCRKMCDMCSGVNTSVSSNTCCDGKLCNNGFVLDTPSCNCRLLCPGPDCDSAVDCGVPAARNDSGEYVLLNGTTLYGSVALLRCGLKESLHTCRENGTWSPPDLLNCPKHAVDCGIPAARKDSGTYILLNGTTTYGSVSLLRCGSKEVLLTCWENGTWSPPDLHCTEHDDKSEREVAALQSTSSHALRVLPYTLYSWLVVFVLLKRTVCIKC